MQALGRLDSCEVSITQLLPHLDAIVHLSSMIERTAGLARQCRGGAR